MQLEAAKPRWRRRLRHVTAGLSTKHRSATSSCLPAVHVHCTSRSETLQVQQQGVLQQENVVVQRGIDGLIDEFTARGLVVLPPETLGVPADLHETIFAKRLSSTGSMVNSIPEMIEVLNAPGVIAALDVLAGRDYAIVPFCHAFFASGATDQCWHKDDNVRIIP